MNNLINSTLIAVSTVFLLLSYQYLPAQSSSYTPEVVKNRFEQLVTNVHQEKIYMHLDRTSYITGESIWFSAYCVDAAYHTLVDHSKVLNVELLDMSGLPVKQFRTRLSGGVGKGQIFVSPDLQSGTYLLRAYTNWMKNFDSEYVFKQHLRILNPSAVGDMGTHKPSILPTVNFFPEGGHLVVGLQSKVAVKAEDGFGNGLALAGIVYDNLDNEVADFSTSNLGYGYFVLTPDPGKSYSARIEIDSTIRRYQLPVVMEAGLTLSIKTSEAGNLIATIDHTKVDEDNLYLVTHTRGIIKKLLQVDLKQKNELTISSGELPPGISHFTLLNGDFEPLSERLVFIYPDTTEFVQLNVDQKEHGKREKMNLSLKWDEKWKQGNWASLSVSVSRSASTLEDADNIVSNLLLTSDLKGSIPDPWIFFNPANSSRVEQLDLVMLTNGWRRFNWTEIKSDQNIQIKYPAEINAPILSGYIKSNEQGMLPKSVQINFLGKASVMNSAGLKPEGLFHFEVPFRVDNEKVLFFTNTDTLIPDQVLIFSPFDLKHPDAIKSNEKFAPDTRGFLETLSTNIQISQVYRDYNHINGLAAEVQQINTPFYGTPDHLYILDNYTRFETIEDLFIEYIRSAVIRDNNRSSGFHIIYEHRLMPGEALTLIDGVPIFDLDYIMNFDPLKIERINVVTDIYRMGNIEYPGIIEFITYQGDFDGQALPENIVEKVYHGLQAPRTFYAPDYSRNQDILKRIPDYRNTLYWNPKVELNGPVPTELEFYTSDDVGLYQIEVNGITNKGEPVYLRRVFEVR